MFQSYIFNDSHSIFFFSSLSLNFARHIYCFLAFSKPETTFQKQEGNSQHLTGAHIIKDSWKSWRFRSHRTFLLSHWQWESKKNKEWRQIAHSTNKIATYHKFLIYPGLLRTGLCTIPWQSVRRHPCQNKTRPTKYSWSLPPWALRTFFSPCM